MSLQQRLSELVDDADIDAATQDLVWAAYDSEAALHDAIAGDPVPAPDPDDHTTSTQPVWLSTVKVQGFRGIGPATELLLNPGPGLTLVVGRNGSGKSSFAEGLEALLTGDNQRWRDRPAAWRQGWRNLHFDGAAEVSAEFQREGDTQPTHIARTFADTFEDSTVATVLNGTDIKFEWLSWDGPLATYKPFLSYNEIGNMLEQKPSAIYDSLAGVLGLDRLTDASDRLRSARLSAEKPGKALKTNTTDIADALGSSTDERAAVALSYVKQKAPDLDAIAVLATSISTPRPELDALAAIVGPDAIRCADAAVALEKSLAVHADHAGSDAERSARLAELLFTAIETHAHDGDGDCPVCGEGRLDAAWTIRAQAEAEQLRSESKAIAESLTAVKRARQSALGAIVASPKALTQPVDGIDMAGLAEAWNQWSTAPDDGFTELDLIERLRSAGDVLAHLRSVKAAVAAELNTLEDDWRPIAHQLAIWVEDARNAEASNALAKRLKVAENFLRTAEADIREERFAPIASQSSELWEGLRQQSNVSLESVALAGKTTNRRVDLDVTVDGTETSALGVMSQGELHALALALFLPRVTSDESPFRFVLIDDPVQAMDPARVDGLAQVLHEVAKTRQVVVFTHDDRLPSACRRLQLATEVIEVDRRTDSRVSTRPVGSPAQTAISDAFALAKTEKLPPDLQRRIVPIHCRRAVEAATRDQVWRRLLSEGKPHHEIDEAISEASKTTDLLSLLFFGTVASTPEVYDALQAIDPSLSGKLGFLNKAVHDAPADLKPTLLVNDTRKLVEAIEGYRP